MEIKLSTIISMMTFMLMLFHKMMKCGLFTNILINKKNQIYILTIFLQINVKQLILIKKYTSVLIITHFEIEIFLFNSFASESM